MKKKAILFINKNCILRLMQSILVLLLKLSVKSITLEESYNLELRLVEFKDI